MCIRKIVLASMIFFLAGCAVNRVEEVKSAEDAESLYKVPVVYGIGIANDSLPPRSSELPAFSFAEYDPIAKKGTSSCLGSADTIWVSFRVPFGQIPQDHDLHYHVMMVPPGYYALSLAGVKPYEAAPSLYIKIEDSGPQYLGDFRLMKSVNLDNKNRTNLTMLPVEYHPQDATQALQSFSIESNSLPHVPLLPTDGVAGFLLCVP